ncbi:MAG: DUF3990 domain-containing protein [Paludibacter sp.]|nr:DUF3990 domain-containing protein [Paludibacter sp.]
MILYHGSTVKVENPSLLKCRSNTDFGKGFYTTTSQEQAEKWSKLKQQREASAKAVVSVYEIDDDLLKQSTNCNVLKFSQANKEWLDFVFANRKGLKCELYDIVYGPVANDRLFATITLYEEGILTADAAIEQLKTYLLFNQVSFHTQKSIDLLTFKTSLEL